MKTKLFLPALFVAAAAAAQNTTPPASVNTTQTKSTGTLSPVAPGLPSSPQSSGLPGFNPQNPILSSTTFPPGQGINFTNLLSTNLSSADLQAPLRNVQAAMEQALPVLAAFNNNLEFVEAGTLGAPNSTGVSAAAPNNTSTAAVNRSSGTLVSQSLGVNFGQNISALAGVPTAPAVATTPQTTTTNGSTFAPTSSATNSFGFGTPIGLGTNNFPVATSAQGTIRALIILQNDMERSLPLLASVNGGIGVSLPNAPGTFSNTFGLSPNQFSNFRTNGAGFQSGTQNRSATTLTPTGR